MGGHAACAISAIFAHSREIEKAEKPDFEMLLARIKKCKEFEIKEGSLALDLFEWECGEDKITWSNNDGIPVHHHYSI